MARFYLRNGGTLDHRIFDREKKPGEWYKDYAERMVSGVLKEAADWSIFEQKESPIFDPASGTQQPLRQIGSNRNLLS